MAKQLVQWMAEDDPEFFDYPDAVRLLGAIGPAIVLAFLDREDVREAIGDELQREEDYGAGSVLHLLDALRALAQP